MSEQTTQVASTEVVVSQPLFRGLVSSIKFADTKVTRCIASAGVKCYPPTNSTGNWHTDFAPSFPPYQHGEKISRCVNQRGIHCKL
jgi:hypothetical protein